MLCQWVTSVNSAIPLGVWEALTDDLAQRGSEVVFALDIAPDHSTASIAVAWKRPDGAAQVMLTDHLPGVDWVVERGAQLVRDWGGRLVVEQTGTAGFLIGPLERAGTPPSPPDRSGTVVSPS